MRARDNLQEDRSRTQRRPRPSRGGSPLEGSFRSEAWALLYEVHVSRGERCVVFVYCIFGASGAASQWMISASRTPRWLLRCCRVTELLLPLMVACSAPVDWLRCGVACKVVGVACRESVERAVSQRIGRALLAGAAACSHR